MSTCQILERLSMDDSRVDRAAGIIRNVKLVGFQSRNTARRIGLLPSEVGPAADKEYSYSRDALREAIPMYEGTTVRFDHPASRLDSNGIRVMANGERSALESVGEVRNVRLAQDGPSR